MISKPTVLILGAGSSMMYGFPSGLELKRLIAHRLRKRGNDMFQLYGTLGFDNDQVDNFASSLIQSGVSSVDSFLEHRPEFIAIGKTAIAEALIPFENESPLFRIENDWYGYLLDKLNTSIDLYDQNKLTILTFNYDRSLEWYFFKAYQARYGIKPDVAVNLISMVGIHHLHGTLGGYPWNTEERSYQSTVNRTEILKARDKIKIIHENININQEFNVAHEALNSAHRIVFLGFGHHKVNISRLDPNRWRKSNQILQSSGYGITMREMIGIKSLFEREIDFGNPDWDVLKFLREKVNFEEK